MMSRQIVAVAVGIIIAVAVIFATFDRRVSFSTSSVTSQVTQPQPSTN
jgi:hypothetical protein